MSVLLTSLLGGAALLLLNAAPWLWENVVVVAMRLWATRTVPEPPGSLLLGHIPTLLKGRFRSFRHFQAWTLQWPVYRIRFFLRPVLVVADPDLYQPLLKPGPSKLPKYTPPYRMFEVFTSPERSNILTSPENPTWKAVRRAAVAALTMNNLKLCFPHITAVTQRLINSLAAAGPTAVHDMDAAAAAITVDVIGLAAFDRDFCATCHLSNSNNNNSASSTNPPPPPPVVNSTASPDPPSTASDSCSQHQASTGACAGGVDGQAGGASGPSGGIRGSVVFGRGTEVLDVISHLVEAMQARNNPLNRWFPWRQAYRDLFYWGGRMSDLVRDLTSSMEAIPPPPHSLGAHLLKAKYGTGEPLERDQIMAELGIMWGAGFETTAHTICWTLFLLATHPEAGARLCAELDSLGLLATPQRPQPAALQWEHLAQLKYLSAVINESMRMYPAAAAGTMRVTDRPMTVAGLHLPAGQPILIPIFSVHHSPRLWDDPNAFKPERFLAAEEAPGVPAAAAAPAGSSSASASTQEAGKADAQGSPAGSCDMDDYVDVAADIAQMQDQEKDHQSARKTGCSSNNKPVGTSSEQEPNTASNLAAAGGIELKDTTVDRRGFLPFSIGNRNCVGQALALVELKAVLAMLVGNFSFEMDPQMGGFSGVDASAKLTVTLRPEHGLLMTLRPRGSTAHDN